VRPDELDSLLVDRMREFYDDPYGFAMFAFDWGEGDLEGWDGPDTWQTTFLKTLGDAIKTRSPGDVIRMAAKTGKGPGKTALQCWLILFFMSTRPNFAGFATANTGDQLDDKLWRELALWHQRVINKHWFEWTATRFYHKQAKATWGIDALKWSENNPDAFGGLHNGGRGQAAFMEEGSGIADPIYDVVDTTMTDADSFIFVFGNPYRKSGRFYEIFTRFRHRWLTLTVDTRTAKAANQKQINDMIEDWGLHSDHVKVNVLGEFPDVEDDVIIPLPLLEAAAKRKVNDQDNNKYKPIWSVDPARSAFGDRSTLCKRRHRKLMEPVKSWRGIDTMQLAGRIINEFEETPRDELPSHIVVDVIGIGAGVVDRLREHDVVGPLVVALNVAETKGIRDGYPRLRDDLWFKAAEWFDPKNGAEMTDNALAGELCSVFFGYTSSGQRKVEPKDDTKERIGHSPDLADSFIGTFAVTPISIAREQDRYERARRRMQSAGATSWAA